MNEGGEQRYSGKTLPVNRVERQLERMDKLEKAKQDQDVVSQQKEEKTWETGRAAAWTITFSAVAVAALSNNIEVAAALSAAALPLGAAAARIPEGMAWAAEQVKQKTRSAKEMPGKLGTAIVERVIPSRRAEKRSRLDWEADMDEAVSVIWDAFNRNISFTDQQLESMFGENRYLVAAEFARRYSEDVAKMEERIKPGVAKKDKGEFR